MSPEEKLGIIRQNTVEIVNEEELKALLESGKKPTVYCGYEVSGEVHLGHMVTTTKLLDFLKAGCRVKVLFADWHTYLNRKAEWDEINKLTKMWNGAFIALGLGQAEFVIGSHIQRNADYIDDVMKIAAKTTINRALRSMQAVARDIENARVSQVIYPFMQIVDMKYLGVDIASSGIEQRKIHMLGREILGDLGYKSPVMLHTPLIPSLQGPGEKMSSSKPETMISVRDQENIVTKKINKAYCPEGDAKDNPVMAIAQLIIFPRIEQFTIERPGEYGGNMFFKDYKCLEQAFADKLLHPADLKKAVAKYLNGIL